MCLVHCHTSGFHTFLVIWSTCHTLNFLLNLATLVVFILLVTFFMAATLCLRLVVAKLVMNQTDPKLQMIEFNSTVLSFLFGMVSQMVEPCMSLCAVGDHANLLAQFI